MSRPDNCDGSYQESCDSSRDYDDITTLLKNAGKTELLDYMDTYWQSNDESSESFWEHEWSTHGTCVNTIDPSCYTDYSTGDEAVDFFQQVVDLFQTLDTYSVRLPQMYTEMQVLMCLIGSVRCWHYPF
jgi:ribonuclease T2